MEQTVVESDAMMKKQAAMIATELMQQQSPDEMPPPLPSYATHPVHQAAMEFVADNGAYRHAVRYVPMVVATESPHEQYFQFSKCDCWHAAKRLVGYWRERLELFGETHCYKPMAQALRPEDVEHLQKAYSCILPPDAQGRPVRFRDRPRACMEAMPPLETRLRCAWFYAHAVSQVCHATGNPEYVGMSRLDASSPLRHDAAKVDRIHLLIQQVFCIRAACVHVVLIHPKGARRTLTRRTGLLQTWRNALQRWQKVPKQVHSGTQEQVQASLRKAGLLPEGLPTTIGGTWSYETDYPKWLQEFGVSTTTKQSPEAPTTKPVTSALAADNVTTEMTTCSQTCSLSDTTTTGQTTPPPPFGVGDTTKKWTKQVAPVAGARKAPISARLSKSRALREKKIAFSRRIRQYKKREHINQVRSKALRNQQ